MNDPEVLTSISTSESNIKDEFDMIQIQLYLRQSIFDVVSILVSFIYLTCNIINFNLLYFFIVT
jgi:hypothetical protein